MHADFSQPPAIVKMEIAKDEVPSCGGTGGERFGGGGLLRENRGPGHQRREQL